MNGALKGLNGKAKATFATMALLVSMLTGMMASAYYFGGVAEDVKNNSMQLDRQEDRIDARVQLHLSPILVELREINRRLERMEK